MTELYLYQILHLNRGRVRQLDAHVRLLDEVSRTLFGCPYSPSLQKLAQRITALAERERYPSGVSGFVRLEIDAEGHERLIPIGTSLYDGYALRSMMPNAITLIWNLPVEVPSSAHEAAAELARQMAQQAGYSEAIRCTPDSIAISLSEASLFAVKGKSIFTSPTTMPSVERELGIKAIRAAGLEIIETPIEQSSLTGFDELFAVDHRGITALEHCDGTPMMHLMAERVAAAMEQLFRKS